MQAVLISVFGDTVVSWPCLSVHWEEGRGVAIMLRLPSQSSFQCLEFGAPFIKQAWSQRSERKEFGCTPCFNTFAVVLFSGCCVC